MTGLPEPVWLAMPRTRGIKGEAPHRDWVAHAIRNGHGLCGLNAARFTWSSDVTGVARCVECGTFPAGYATSIDITMLGLTYRKLDWYCRKGWIRPDDPHPGSGTRRLFPPDEYEAAVWIARLVGAGVSPDAAASAARCGGWLAAGVRVTVDDLVVVS